MPSKITVLTATKPASGSRAGRKPIINSLTPDQIETACEALELGFPQARIASLLNVSEAAMSRMLKRDEEVAGRLRGAKAQGVKNNLAVIQMHAAKSWQAAAWLLERCNGSTFAQRAAQTGATVQVNLQNVLSAQAHRPAERLKAAAES